MLRFLANLEPDIVKEKEWIEFSRKVLPAVPEITLMEMSLTELQSFTVNFNLIRRRQGIQDEENFAKKVQEMLVSCYEHHFTELQQLSTQRDKNKKMEGYQAVILAADQVSQLEGCSQKFVGRLLRLIEESPSKLEPSVLLNLVDTSARVKYAAKML